MTTPASTWISRPLVAEGVDPVLGVEDTGELAGEFGEDVMLALENDPAWPVGGERRGAPRVRAQRLGARRPGW